MDAKMGRCLVDPSSLSLPTHSPPMLSWEPDPTMPPGFPPPAADRLRSSDSLLSFLPVPAPAPQRMGAVMATGKFETRKLVSHGMWAPSSRGCWHGRSPVPHSQLCADPSLCAGSSALLTSASMSEERKGTNSCNLNTGQIPAHPSILRCTTVQRCPLLDVLAASQ